MYPFLFLRNPVFDKNNIITFRMEKPKILGQDPLKTMALCDWIANLAILHLDKPVS